MLKIDRKAKLEDALCDLRAAVKGTVITPGDADYDAARQGWNLAVDNHPAVIVQAASRADVAAAVRFASVADLEIAVRSTGHGAILPADGCLLLVTSALTGVRVDAVTRTAYVEAGVKWGAVLEAAQKVGLAPLLGSSPGVGVVGYTLGGGMGWLARKYGLATDSVVYFEVVTAAGEAVRASATEHPTLFWALRGGGGNFGVVTGMEIRLYPVTEVYGGNLFYPASQVKAVFQRYRDWIAAAPEELTSAVVIMNFPPIPALPEHLRGQSFVIVRGCYCGPVTEGEALLKYWRDWQTPVMDAWQAMPFAEAASISADPVDPMPGMASGAWLADLSDDAIDTIIRYGRPGNGPSPLVKVEIRHAGGAISRVSPEAAAYGNRDATLIMETIAVTPTPEVSHAIEEYNREFQRALTGHLTGGVYLNFLEGREARERTPDAFSVAAFHRLIAAKAAYDPDNRFSHSFAIPATFEG
jgi:FAD/FMN-containing dehydrogenase